METHAKVVVIGGGVVGCSILFHLAKFGLKSDICEDKSLNFPFLSRAAGISFPLFPHLKNFIFINILLRDQYKFFLTSYVFHEHSVCSCQDNTCKK